MQKYLKSTLFLPKPSWDVVDQASPPSFHSVILCKCFSACYPESTHAVLWDISDFIMLNIPSLLACSMKLFLSQSSCSLGTLWRSLGVIFPKTVASKRFPAVKWIHKQSWQMKKNPRNTCLVKRSSSWQIISWSMLCVGRSELYSFFHSHPHWTQWLCEEAYTH